MTKNTASSDLRSELSDLVKRRIEVAVRQKQNVPSKLQTSLFIFASCTGNTSQPRKTNLRIRRELP